MCGVIGFHCDKPLDIHVVKLVEIFKQSYVRGTHASGFAIPNERGLYVKRSTSLESVCIDLLRYRNDPFKSMIGHTRYSTSGDFEVDSNNQPLVGRRTAVAFNGVISQAPKSAWEKMYGKRFNTENDGEIFLRKVEDDEDWQAFVAKGRFSFAGVILTKDGTVHAIRNKQRPLYRARYAGALFIASTADIFLRAGSSDFTHVEPLIAGVPYAFGSEEP